MKPKRTLETQQDMKAPSNLTSSPEIGEGLVWSCPCREGLRLEQQQAAAAGKPVTPTLATPKGYSTSACLLLTSLSLGSSQYHLGLTVLGLADPRIAVLTPTSPFYAPRSYVINKRMLASLTDS